MGYRSTFTNTIIVDAGSENLRISYRGKVVFNEYSCISIDHTNKRISGFGNSVLKTDRQIKPVNRVLFDFHAFEHLLRKAIKSATNKRSWLPVSYKMYFTIPCSTSEVEKRAYRDSAEHAGARAVYMVHQPNAIAVGMRLLLENKHFIIIDFGASKIEMTAIAESNIIGTISSPFGTWKFKALIRSFIKRKYEIILDDIDADRLLHVLFDKLKDRIILEGKEITSSELEEYVMPYIRIINDDFLELVEKIENSPHFKSVIANGIFFSGGGTSYKGLMSQIIKLKELRNKITVSESPLLDNINGATKIVNHISEFESIIFV